jgi:hypothetical protein
LLLIEEKVRRKEKKKQSIRNNSGYQSGDLSFLTSIFSIVGGPGPVVPGLPYVGGKAPRFAAAAVVS